MYVGYVRCMHIRLLRFPPPLYHWNSILQYIPFHFLFLLQKSTQNDFLLSSHLVSSTFRLSSPLCLILSLLFHRIESTLWLFRVLFAYFPSKIASFPIQIFLFLFRLIIIRNTFQFQLSIRNLIHLFLVVEVVVSAFCSFACISLSQLPWAMSKRQNAARHKRLK